MKQWIIFLMLLMLLCGCGCKKFEWASEEVYDLSERELVLEGGGANGDSGEDELWAQNEGVAASDPAAPTPAKTDTPSTTAHGKAGLSEPIQQPAAVQPTADPATAAEKSALQPDAQTRPPCININEADVSQLMTLPGIGKKRAQDIIQMRNKKPFRRKTDLQRVKGIGKKTYQKLAANLCDL